MISVLAAYVDDHDQDESVLSGATKAVNNVNVEPADDNRPLMLCAVAGMGPQWKKTGLQAPEAFAGSTSTGYPDSREMTWRVTLNEASDHEVTVYFRYLSGTAEFKTDGVYAYYATTSITFAPGTTSQTVSYEIEDDSSDETDEALVLEAYNLLNARFEGGGDVLRTTSWILDDDGSAADLALFISSPLLVETDEGSQNAVFELSLSRPAPQAFEVSYNTFDGTAIAGSDYEATSCRRISDFPD